MGLIELLGSIIIFDEIHAYDPHICALIDVIIERLKIMGVRFMFMSATFPDFIIKRIEKSLPGIR